MIINENKLKAISVSYVVLLFIRFTRLIIPVVLLSSSVLHAQSVNPYEGDRRAIRAGESLFRARCATCHGADAAGIQDLGAPDLRSLWLDGHDDGSVFRTIDQGISGTIMPPSNATERETWALVAYLKDLGASPSLADAPGDPELGRRLFRARCLECHRINGEGGSLGPDLSRIGAIRAADHLKRSIRDPQEAVGRGYRMVTLETREEVIQGLVKNEDAFSIQIMDTRERLRGFRKADLRQLVRHEISLMPAYDAEAISDGELDDLLHYLRALRGSDSR